MEKCQSKKIIIPNIKGNEENEKWDDLISQIVAGNVIPVIGSSVLIEEGDINQIVINALAEEFKIQNKPTSFSQLINDPLFPKENRDGIYTLLNAICLENQFLPSQLLKKILGIKYFPFVITTSFFPIVENTMKKIYGENNVKTLVFSNNPSSTAKVGVGDIMSEKDIEYPSVYYMFGKHSNAQNRFVVTDIDMLNFCRSWMTQDLRPLELSNVLKKKYLLMLGNNYQDWLFRFIWFSIKQNNTENFYNRITNGMVVNEDAEDSLVYFLNCLHTFTQTDPNFVIDRIEKELAKRQKMTDVETDKFDAPQNNTDVFISYSRREKLIADQLYEILTDLGFNVWYDKKNLCIGQCWMEDIKNAIESAKLFVPILSNSIVNEIHDHHPYRQEWKIAIERSDGYGRTFICPVVEDGFNYLDAKASKMKDIHSYIYDKTSLSFKPFVKEISNLLSCIK